LSLQDGRKDFSSGNSAGVHDLEIVEELRQPEDIGKLATG
jgi:hypothetical protein